MDQHSLARRDAGVIEQHLPRRHRHDRDGGGPDVVEGQGLRSEPRCLGHGVFGVSPGEPRVRDPVHLVPRLQTGYTRPH